MVYLVYILSLWRIPFNLFHFSIDVKLFMQLRAPFEQIYTSVYSIYTYICMHSYTTVYAQGNKVSPSICMQLHVLASILKTLAKVRLTVVAVIVVVVVVVVGLPLYIQRHFAAEISIKWFGFMLTKYIVFLWYFVCLSGIFYAYFMPCLTSAPFKWFFSFLFAMGYSDDTRTSAPTQKYI